MIRNEKSLVRVLNWTDVIVFMEGAQRKATPSPKSEIRSPQFEIRNQYTPTVVASANLLNGLTPLTPSQGYFS
jgi:hypothetical protein